MTTGSQSTNLRHAGLRLAGPFCAPAVALLRTFWPSDKYLWPLSLAASQRDPGAQQPRWLDTKDGIRMELVSGTYPDSAILHGVFEVRTVKLLQRLLRPGDRVVDIGANIGWFSILCARLVGPTGRVHSFEPLPTNLERLKANIEANTLGNVTIHPYGAGRETGEFEIYIEKEDDQVRHMLASLRPMSKDARPTKCQIRRLDDVLDEPVHLVKIDIEGAEVEAIMGASKFLARHTPHLIIEFNVPTLAAFQQSPLSVFDAIKAIDPGYTLWTIDGFTNRQISRDEVARWPSGNYANVWFRPPA